MISFESIAPKATKTQKKKEYRARFGSAVASILDKI